MADRLPILKVHMLGRASVTYGDISVLHSRGGVTKAKKLLMILLYNGKEGVGRDILLQEMFGREEMADVANSLLVTIHRLRKLLADAGLPEYDYITVKGGVYKWSGPMELEIDAVRFRELIRRADKEPEGPERILLLREALEMYEGEFLEDMSGEEWALVESVSYKKMYEDALLEVCGYLKKQGDYEEVLRLCGRACRLYPFDEWQCVRMDCYIAMHRYKDAIKEYEDTAKLFFEELGIEPSERMLLRLEAMGNQVKTGHRVIREIKDRLKEESRERGAFYCSLPSFRDQYRLMCRMMERSGQSIYLMLCTITDGKTGSIQEDAEKLSAMAPKLHSAIKHCLRRCDTFTQLNPAQFLVLLMETNGENCDIIIDRIARKFSQEYKSWKRCLECHISSVAEVEKDMV